MIFTTHDAACFGPDWPPETGCESVQAQASFTALAGQLAQSYPRDNEGRTLKAVSLRQARIDPDGSGQLLLASGVMMGVVALVLLIACANIANLLLARASGRRKEIAARLAIGANRARLIRQLLTESLVLSMVGGVIGCLVTFWAKDLLHTIGPFGGGPNAPPKVLANSLWHKVSSCVTFKSAIWQSEPWQFTWRYCNSLQNLAAL